MKTTKKNILLLFGGGGHEHEISSVSAGYVEKKLKEISWADTFVMEIKKGGTWVKKDGKPGELNFRKELCIVGERPVPVDYAIPCIHGHPGETGDIQSFFEMIGLPYFGCGPEANRVCFNKLLTKFWMQFLGIPQVPFVCVSSPDSPEMDGAFKFLETHKAVFVKPSSEGSSVGCHPANTADELLAAVVDALEYSDNVLVEKRIRGRELEIATYEINGEIITTLPGEVVIPTGGYYSYDEKYGKTSQATTVTIAQDVTPAVQNKMRDHAGKIFRHLHLKHLSRIDFFLTDQNEILLNEINTMPGMTPISMFPKMVEANGHSFKNFLEDSIARAFNKGARS
jgi:D-alanine-D-alanine ligase